MAEKKKMGRPPAEWMFKLRDYPFDKQWTDTYEVAKNLGIHVKTVKSFLDKLKVKPRHIIIDAKTRAQFKVKDLKEATRLYIEPWVDRRKM